MQDARLKDEQTKAKVIQAVEDTKEVKNLQQQLFVKEHWSKVSH